MAQDVVRLVPGRNKKGAGKLLNVGIAILPVNQRPSESAAKAVKLPIVRYWQRLDTTLTPEDLKSAQAAENKSAEKYGRPARKIREIGSTLDAEKASSWFKDENVSFGLCAGLSGMVVIDCDVKSKDNKGKKIDGLSAFRQLCADNGFDLRTCPAVRTPSGGYHYYFLADAEHLVGNQTGELPLGIDVRGTAGFVFGPGATRPDGTRYVQDAEHPDLYDAYALGTIPQIPKWLLRILGDPIKKNAGEGDSAEPTDSKIIKIAVEYATTVEPAIEGQGGNDRTYKVACHLADIGCDEQVALDILSTYFDPRCEPPWGDELEEPVHNAFNYKRDKRGNKTENHFGDAPIDTSYGIDLHPDADDTGKVPPASETKKREAYTFFDGMHKERDLTKMEPRKFVYGASYLKGYPTLTISPGGRGKSALTIAEAVCISMGVDYLWGGRRIVRQRVHYWNGEDKLDEIEKRVGAFAKRHGVDHAELEQWLSYSSGRKKSMKIASEQAGVCVPDKHIIKGIIQTCLDQKIGVLIIDPIVSTHDVSENNNTAMQKVMAEWVKICELTDVALHLVLHSRKVMLDQKITADDNRGASSVVAASRSARVLNIMSLEEAQLCKIEPSHRKLYLHAEEGDKENFTFSSVTQKRWVKLDGEPLGNTDVLDDWPDGDEVGIPTLWELPVDAGLEPDQLEAILTAIDVPDANYMTRAAKNTNWLGWKIAELTDRSADDKIELERIIKTLLKDKHIKIGEGISGKDRHKIKIYVRGAGPESGEDFGEVDDEEDGEMDLSL